MLCKIFKSSRKADTYLYLKQGLEFEQLADDFQKMFGEPQWVMDLDLAQRDRLANADIDKVREDLNGKGFYLQLPPEIID